MITANDEAPTVAEAIGTYVTSYRKRHRITRDALAAAGAAYGMTWGHSSIENIEKGRFSPTISTLFVLRNALRSQTPDGTAADAYPTLLRMLPTTGRISIADGYSIPVVKLREFLGDDEAITTIGEDLDDYMRQFSTPAPPVTLAEKRAAQRLGIDVNELQDLAIELWAESLDHVVRGSIASDATAQARGHETRRRVEELKRYKERRTNDG